MLAAAEHLGLTLLDGQELVGEVALADEVPALLHARLVGERGELPKLFLGDRLEQWNRLQSVVIHSFSSLAEGRATLSD